MKQRFLLCCLLCTVIATVFAQDENTLLRQIAGEKNDSLRIEQIIRLFALHQDTDPLKDMQAAKNLLQHAYDAEDRVSEAMALSEIGYAYKSIGDMTNGLDFAIRALDLAEDLHHELLEAILKINLGVVYKDLTDYPKAIPLFSDAATKMAAEKNDKIQSWALMNLAQVYYDNGKTDSALMYAQRTYELVVRTGYTTYLGFICTQLGKIHARLGNTSLANGFFEMAIRDAQTKNAPKYISQAYFGLAEFQQQRSQKDSAIIYATRSVEEVAHTSLFVLSMKPAKLLSSLYEGKNNDSTIKYLKLFIAANDSLYNLRSIQQVQVLSFENELHQQQLAKEKQEAEEKRQQNIQYVLLALGIVAFIFVVLLLSRAFITNERMIEFLGVIALLLVFEFLNLLLHPLLVKITHHSPVQMLLALVCLGAILAPLHHKAEKWAIKKILEKNKRVRLESAHRTIEKLEKEL